MPIDLSNVTDSKGNPINIQSNVSGSISRSVIEIIVPLFYVNNNAPVNRDPETTHETAIQMIHRYAVVHSIIALILGPFAGFALTVATVKMICELGNYCGVKISQQGVTNFVAHYIGLFAGMSIAQFLGGLIPGIGNLSNSISSFFVTQALGRTTLSLFENGFNLDKSEFSSEERKVIKRTFKENLKETINNASTFNNMNENDKNDYNRYTEILERANQDENIAQNEIIFAQDKIKEILDRYEQQLKNNEDRNQEARNLVKISANFADTIRRTINKFFNLLR